MSRASRWVLLVGACCGSLAEAQDRPRLAEVVGPVQPSARLVDARLLPPAPTWHAGLAPFDAEPEQEGDAERLSQRPWLAGVPVLARPMKSQTTMGTRGGPSFSLAAPNVAGINYTFALPADPAGDAGPNHYVQAVNGAPSTRFAVYDKNSGALVAGPADMTALGTGDCAVDVADPQVIYDTLANRWLLARIVANAKICVFLSSGSDPVNTVWTQYEFPFGFFPDYPKLAVWDDAYGLTFNSFLVDGTNVRFRFAVLDRLAMLAGQPATAQVFETTRISNGNNPFAPLVAVGLKGANPPKPNTPIQFLAPIDEEYQFFGEPGEMNFASDRLMQYTVDPDFATPAATVVTGPTPIEVHDLQLYVGTFPLQPNGHYLPSFAGTPMHRATYRNLGDREVITLAMAQSVDPFTDYDDAENGRHLGVHWIELERVNGAAGAWQRANQGVFGPGDGAARFMPAISVDSAGNLALAYSILRQDPAIHPGLRYTGRQKNDAADEMTFAESVLAEGAQSQDLPPEFRRWGDYFDMSIDPDGCRFWFTGAYMDDFNWGTRIGSFRHDDCGPPDFSLDAVAGPTPVCSANAVVLPSRSLHVASENGFWRDVSLSMLAPPAGISAQITPAQLRPSADASVEISIAQGTSSGLKTVIAQAADGPVTRQFNFQLDVDQSAPAAASLVSPANGVVQQPNIVRLQWDPIAGARDYVVEVSTDPGFGSVFFGRTTTDPFVDTSVLPGNTVFHWRVRGGNLCGEGSNSAVRQFTTVADFCTIVNVPLPANSTRTHIISVPTSSAGVLQNLDVRTVVNNVPASDLSVDVLRVAGAQSRRLFANGCNAATGMNTIFDDAQAAPACNGTNLAARTQPTESLSVFDYTALAGDWQITVQNHGSSPGQFILWCLQPQSLLPVSLHSNGFE